MISDERVRECLADRWGISGAVVEAHHGGMNSATWFVSRGGSRWVAKAVPPAARRSFAAGLAVAAVLEAAARIPAGGPDRAGPLLAATWTSARCRPPRSSGGLPVMLRFRWAVQADYFARRIAAGDLTGIATAAENEAGLADARQWLSAYGVDLTTLPGHLRTQPAAAPYHRGSWSSRSC